MVFAHPDNLYLFGLFVIFVAAWMAYAMWHRKVRQRAGDEALIEAMTATADRFGSNFRRVLQFAGMALLIIALAGPRWGMTDEEVEHSAIDIVFALDLSRSMLADDVSPNRLTASNTEVREIMNRLEGDRVGLVIFTSLSFVQAPLTTDYSAIDFFMERLHPDQIPVGGTNIGAAMDDSIQLLEGRATGDENGSQMRRAENQIIVLFTDGEDHESAPIIAAEQAREAGIRVVTIGVGSPDGSRIPAYDDHGNRTGYILDENNVPVVTTLDEQTLREIATITDGLFIPFEQAGQASNQLVAFLDELERTTFEKQITERYIDRFMWFLVPGFLLLLASLFFGRRRSASRKILGLFLVSSLLLTTSIGCDGPLKRVDPDGARASEAIAAGDYELALTELDALAEEYGQRSEYHFNRGRAYFGLGEYHEARQAFAGALSSNDPDLRADVHYHLGLTFGADEDWREASDSFRDGLRLYSGANPPTDAELRWDLKQNLEVALRELFPPCSTFADEFAGNDTAHTAPILDELSLADLTLCGGTDDYFSLPVAPGGTLNIDASLSELRDEPDPEHVFLPRSSGIKLIVYGPDGTTPLVIDEGVEDSDDLRQENHLRRLDRRIQNFKVDVESPTHIFIALHADAGLEFAYDLDIEYVPPCSALDDQFEPNSNADDAALLPRDSHQLHLCPGDEDWFRLQAERGDSLFVDIVPETDDLHDEPPSLEIELRRADDGSLIGIGHHDGSTLSAGLSDVDFDGDVLMRIVGADEDETGPYTAEVHHFEACAAPSPAEQQDQPQSAEQLSADAPEHRYLRLCPGETAHYIIPHDAGEPVEWTLRNLPDDAWRGDPDVDSLENPFGLFPDIELDLLGADTITAFASTADLGDDQDDLDITADPPPQATASLTENHILYADQAPHNELVLLRASGDSGFFHLRRSDEDQDQDDGDDPDDDQDDSDEDDDQDQDEDDDQDQDEDEGDDEDETDQDEDDQDEDEGDGDDGDEEEDETDQDETDQDEEGQDDTDDPGETDEEEADAPPSESDQILRSLEETDQNFQLQRAIENTAPREIDRDW